MTSTAGSFESLAELILSYVEAIKYLTDNIMQPNIVIVRCQLALPLSLSKQDLSI